MPILQRLDSKTHVLIPSSTLQTSKVSVVPYHAADRHKSASRLSIALPRPRNYSILPLETAEIIFGTSESILSTKFQQRLTARECVSPGIGSAHVLIILGTYFLHDWKRNLYDTDTQYYRQNASIIAESENYVIISFPPGAIFYIPRKLCPTRQIHLCYRLVHFIFWTLPSFTCGMQPVKL